MVNMSVPSVTLEQLREDYAQVTGAPFKHFFCPMLWKDEAAETCEGHVIGKPYKNTRVPQRKDVDNFFGSVAEAAFGTLIETKGKNVKDIFVDHKLRDKVRPTLVVGDKEREFYVPDPDKRNHHKKPRSHVLAQMQHSSKDPFDFVLKMGLDEVVAAQAENWEFIASKDCRLSAVISLIKAAYLTLFHMFGYGYALSGAGHSVGVRILGDFYQKCNGKPKLAKTEARDWFQQYAHMVRPVQSLDGITWQGTIEDNIAITCHTLGGARFALGVLVRTNEDMHVVLMPVFDDLEAVPLYVNFLKNDIESIGIKPCRYDKSKGCWESEKEPPRPVTWPKKGETFTFA
jgi:hypothetical protein